MSTARPLATLLPDARSPRAAALIALMLRLALGIGTLNMGLVGYMTQRVGVPGGMPMRFRNPMNPYMGVNAFGQMTGSVSIDAGHQIQAAGQIGLGVAVLLGFCTVVTAASIGFLSILPSALSTLFLISSGMTSDFPGAPNPLMFAPMTEAAMFSSVNVPTLLLVSLVVWLSSLGIKPFSLDALILARRTDKVHEGSGVAGSTADDGIPRSDRAGSLVVPFDPEMALKDS